MHQPTGYEPLFTLKPVAPEVWLVDGPIIRFYGLPFPTRMCVVRLPDGGLWLHSPIEPDPGLVAELATLGPVRHLVAPNWIHYAFVASWQGLFPQARAWAAPGVRERARSRGQTLDFDDDLESTAPPDWAGVIDQELVAGCNLHREVAFCHRPSRTLILTDLIENFEARAVPAWLLPMVWLAGNLDPDGKAPIDLRMGFRGGLAEARASVERILSWAPRRVVLAHGRWYPENAEAELRRAFRWVLR